MADLEHPDRPLIPPLAMSKTEKRQYPSPPDYVIHCRWQELQLFAVADGTGRVAVEIERGDFELFRVGALEPHGAGELSDAPGVAADVDDAFDVVAYLFGLMVGLAFLRHHLKQDAARGGQRLVIERHGDDVAQFKVA